MEITRGGHPVKRAVTREIFIPRPGLFNSIVDRRPRYENTLPLVHYSRHEQLSNLIPVYTTRGEMENDMIFDVNFYSVLLFTYERRGCRGASSHDRTCAT